MCRSQFVSGGQSNFLKGFRLLLNSPHFSPDEPNDCPEVFGLDLQCSPFALCVFTYHQSRLPRYHVSKCLSSVTKLTPMSL